MGNPVSNPELANGEYQRNKVLLYLSDVFGPQLPNAQLLVDGFAKNGIRHRRLPPISSKKMDFGLMYSNPRKTGKRETNGPYASLSMTLTSESILLQSRQQVGSRRLRV
ncbi:hypothetical protein F5051DRAFT_430912 [Lentinula edodes]|nr:hypothetical protein F5051DRAFT_430912 [Lentinula edodes]